MVAVQPPDTFIYTMDVAVPSAGRCRRSRGVDTSRLMCTGFPGSGPDWPTGQAQRWAQRENWDGCGWVWAQGSCPENPVQDDWRESSLKGSSSEVHLMELEDMSAGPLAMLIGCPTIGIIVSSRRRIMNIYCAKRVY